MKKKKKSVGKLIDENTFPSPPHGGFRHNGKPDGKEDLGPDI